MICIKNEIKKIESGEFDKTDNVLKNAPHTSHHIAEDEWNHKYTRKEASFPARNLVENKYWPPVGRVNNVYGDRNLMCNCPSMEEFN
jgi:glycine dehydrogenase